MANREKVIELFSSCISKGGWNNCTNCEHGKAQAVLTCKPLAEDVLKVLKEQNTVDHALEVLRQAGWTESQDVPFPAELLKEQETIDKNTGEWKNGHCSCCGEDVSSMLDTWTNVQNFLFCPICGAKMEER